MLAKRADVEASGPTLRIEEQSGDMHVAPGGVQGPQRHGRALRVLHLPTNVASIPAHTVRAERALGIDARAIEYTWTTSPIVDTANVEQRVLPKTYRSCDGVRCIAGFARRVAWADVLHWYFSTRLLPRGLDFAIVRALSKPRVVEWMGSDIRNPEFEAADNPVFRERMEAGGLAGIWSGSRAARSQADFQRAGFVPLAAPGMVQYVLPEYLSDLRVVDRAVVLDDYPATEPRDSRHRLVVAHAPSRTDIKGTDAVLEAARSLESEFDFEFDLIHGVPRAQAMARISRSDVFIDQLVLGDYGMAAIEAMAMGVPVVCYVKPSLRTVYGDLPVEDAMPATITDVLRRLLRDADRRAELSRRGLAYARERHDATKRALALAAVYADVLRR